MRLYNPERVDIEYDFFKGCLEIEAIERYRRDPSSVVYMIEHPENQKCRKN